MSAAEQLFERLLSEEKLISYIDAYTNGEPAPPPTSTVNIPTSDLPPLNDVDDLRQRLQEHFALQTETHSMPLPSAKTR